MTKADTIRELLRAGSTAKGIAKSTGWNYDMVRGVASKFRKKEEAAKKAAEEALEPVVDRLKKRVQLLEKTLKDAQQHELSQAEVRQAIFGLAQAPVEVPNWPFPGAGPSGPIGTPLTIWSDWHLGEVVNSREVNGVNEFNLEIAERRVRRLVAKTVELCYEHMVNPTYPGIVVCLGGDMVSGEIHDELTQTNDDDLLPVVLKAAEWITAGLRTLADHFGRVFCPCVAGNHGRNTHKIQNKRFPFKNFDWLIYQLVEREFRDDPRVTFSIPDSNEVLFRVYDHAFFLVHGHDLGVSGGDGIIGALGPITRGTFKVGRQQAQIGREFDTLLMGHWHQYIPLASVIVNNSLKGFDEFAHKRRFSYSPPSQALLFVNPKYGITAHWQILVGAGDRSRRKPTNWVSVQARDDVGGER